jgi:hypothetical protein
VREICRDDDMPCRDTLFEWIRQDRDGFGGRYRQARASGGAPGRIDYTREIANRVIEDLMGGRTISEICGDPDMPGLTAINSWIATDRDGFAARYKEARKTGYEAIGDELLGIVDDRRNDWIEWRDEDGVLRRMLDPQRNIRTEMRARTRWRLLSKMLPEPFGDHKDAAARPGGGASASDLAEMRALINGRSRGLPGEDEPCEED